MLFLFLLLAVVYAAVDQDEITDLPGWNGKLSSKHYSGYIEIPSDSPGLAPATSMSIHYYYIETTSKSKEESPLLLWSNGGPGASSMFGLLTEIGPYVLNERSLQTPEYHNTSIPTLFPNQYSWTKFSNILIFDWPPPTGYSYCNNDANGDGYSCGDWNDHRMAQIEYSALEGFLKLFPKLKSNGLFITGESYAGVYIPVLGKEIISHNKVEEWNLKGVAIGDACMGTEVMCSYDSLFGPYYDLLFLYGKSAFSNVIWNALMKYCGLDALQYTYNKANNQEKCDNAINKAYKQAGYYYDYSFYDTCYYENSFRRKLNENDNNYKNHISNMNWRNNHNHRNHNNRDSIDHIDVSGALNDYPCGGGDAQAIYTDSLVVREALHVPLNSNFFSGDNAVGMNYDLTEKSLIPFFYDIATKSEIRSMVYNGDTDPSINAFAAENWTLAMDLKQEEEWRTYTTDSCIATGGAVTSYSGDFKFVTIRGSGHMVPTFKPQVGYIMMESFIKNKDLPEYNPECTSPPPTPPDY